MGQPIWRTLVPYRFITYESDNLDAYTFRSCLEVLHEELYNLELDRLTTFSHVHAYVEFRCLRSWVDTEHRSENCLYAQQLHYSTRTSSLPDSKQPPGKRSRNSSAFASNPMVSNQTPTSRYASSGKRLKFPHHLIGCQKTFHHGKLKKSWHCSWWYTCNSNDAMWQDDTAQVCQEEKHLSLVWKIEPLARGIIRTMESIERCVRTTRINGAMALRPMLKMTGLTRMFTDQPDTAKRVDHARDAVLRADSRLINVLRRRSKKIWL